MKDVLNQEKTDKKTPVFILGGIGNSSSIEAAYSIDAIKAVVKNYCRRIRILAKNNKDDDFLEKEAIGVKVCKKTVIKLLNDDRCTHLGLIFAIDNDNDGNLDNQTVVLSPLDAEGKVIGFKSDGQVYYGEERWPTLLNMEGLAAEDEASMNQSIYNFFYTTLGIKNVSKY